MPFLSLLLIHRVELKLVMFLAHLQPSIILVANPPCGVETALLGRVILVLLGVANPPCGVETLFITAKSSLLSILVANPPCGVETNKRTPFLNCFEKLLIHRVELKLKKEELLKMLKEKLLIHRVELKLLSLLRLSFAEVGLLIHRVELKPLSD